MSIFTSPVDELRRPRVRLGAANPFVGSIFFKFRPSLWGGRSGRINKIGFDTTKQDERRDCAERSRHIETEPRTYIEQNNHALHHAGCL